ncbi:MAG: hypothetical protein U5K69_22530 [Balneolaceae bacterium]|nr:hypothetical protein [Balneolaceae bacterium]
MTKQRVARVGISRSLVPGSNCNGIPSHYVASRGRFSAYTVSSSVPTGHPANLDECVSKLVDGRIVSRHTHQ